MFALLYGYQGALDFRTIARMAPPEREWYIVRMAEQLEAERAELPKPK